MAIYAMTESQLRQLNKSQSFSTKLMSMINASKRIPAAYRFLGVEFGPLGQTGSEYTFAGK